MVIVGCCEAIIAIFLPPLAVLMRKGCSGSLLINIILTILGWIPGVIHAWFVIASDPGLRRRNHHTSSSSRPHSSHGHDHGHSSHGHHYHSSSSHAGHYHGQHNHHHHHSGHGHGHGHGQSHTGRHHARPARKNYDRPAYRGDGYQAPPPAAASSRYGIGAPPQSYGPPAPEMGYAAPPPGYGYGAPPPPPRSRY